MELMTRTRFQFVKYAKWLIGRNMAKIYVLMGKSSTGKDTVYKELMAKTNVSPITMYTTRPMRDGETDGKEYFFVTDEVSEKYEEANRIIEIRKYNTVHGIWKYFTLDDDQIKKDSKNTYLVIATLEAYEKYIAYYGSEMVIPIYIEVDDRTRIHRAMQREDLQENPKYAEMCRRFLADEEDFSEEKIINAGIKKRYINDSLLRCVEEIIADMN